jgi:hypothetical protein
MPSPARFLERTSDHTWPSGRAGKALNLAKYDVLRVDVSRPDGELRST